MMTDKEERQGNCYKFAICHLWAQGEGTLIHAKVWSYKLGRFIGHALVETDTGFIYEPVTDQYMDKERMYALYRVEELKRYTYKEAIAMVAKTHTYGPWDKAVMALPHNNGPEERQRGRRTRNGTRRTRGL